MHVEDIHSAAAISALRTSLEAIRTTTNKWPTEVADDARRTALSIASAIDEALAPPPALASDRALDAPAKRRDVVGDRPRRRAMRMAIVHALELATICDAARAHGLCADELPRAAARTLAMLALVYHSTLPPTE